MKEPIEDIRSKLRNNIYTNKEQVRISIVGRMLHNLGWDLWNPNEVFPDYSASSTDQPWFDLALFVSQSAPSLIIDIYTPDIQEIDSKQLEQKLHDYDGDKTNLLLIQTDGQHWNFYCTEPEQDLILTHFKTIDVLADDIDNLVLTLDTFVSKNNIGNGAAAREARNILMQSKLEDAVVEVLDKARHMVTEPPYPRLPQAVVELIIIKGLTITESEVIKYLEKIEVKKTAKTSESKQTPEIIPEQESVVEQEPEMFIDSIVAQENENEQQPEPEPPTLPEPEPPVQQEPDVQTKSETVTDSDSTPEPETEAVREPEIEITGEDSEKPETGNKEPSQPKIKKSILHTNR